MRKSPNLRLRVSRYDAPPWPHSFALTPDSLARLDRVLRKIENHLVFSASCSDNITRTFETVEQLCAYPNPERSEIQTLTITSRDGEGARAVEIEIATGRKARLSINLSAEERLLEFAIADTRDSLIQARPLYACFAELSSERVLGTLVSCLALVLILLIWTHNPFWSLFLVISGYTIGGLFGWRGALTGLDDALFPKGVILIRDSVNKERRRHFWRNSVALAAALGVVGSVASAMLCG